MKQRGEVWLAIEEANAALTILDTEIGSENLDRQRWGALAERARTALDKAQLHLSDALREAKNALDRI